MAPTRRLQPRFFQPRCLNQSDFNRGVLHHGVSNTVFSAAVFSTTVFSTTVFSSAVFSNTAPSFPPWSSRPHWRFHQRLAWPAGRTGWQSHPTGSVSACRPTAATWTPRQYHPARLKSWPSTGFMIPVRSTRAVMGVPGLKGRGWLSEMAPGNSSVSRATQSTSRRSASPSFVSPRSMPPRSILPCSKPPCSTSPPLLAVSGVIGPNVPASSNSPESFPATPWPSVRPVPPSPRRHVAERRGSPRLREDRPGRDFDTA